jgi:tetratricopeptide (TPR) repeat protein
MESAITPSTQQTASLPKAQAKRPWYRHPFLIAGLAIVILLLSGTGAYILFLPKVQPLSLPKLPAHLTLADLGLGDWQSYQQPFPADPLQAPDLPATPQINTQLALLQDAAGQTLIQQHQIARGLAYLQAAAQSDPDNLRYANDYRLALRTQKRFDDEANFFANLLKTHNTVPVQIAMALSYVDQMRSCPPPPDGLVCQAQFSSRSISQLDGVLTAQPYNIVARYARGLNHLYWPRLMQHLPRAAQDLSYSVALTGTLNQISNHFTDNAYTALGDAFAKDGQIDAARNVWLNGLQIVHGSSLLQSRLAIAKDQLVDEESASLRGLGVYVETDLSLFWTK